MSRRQLYQIGGKAVAPMVSVWGQSNAAGNEFPVTDLPAEYAGDQRGILSANYGEADEVRFRFLPLNPATTSARVYTMPSSVSALWGVEQSLTHLLRDHYNKTIYLDKLAYGGYFISEWQKGGHWYDKLLTIAIEEKHYFNVHNLTPKWLPVIWIQGEADSGDATSVYQPKLEALIDQERLNSTHNRPWIFQKLSTYQTSISPTDRAHINNAFDNIAGGTRPHCYVLDPSNYTLVMDVTLPGLHYGPAAFQILGQKYFYLMLANGLL